MISTLPSAPTTSFSSVNATDLREDLRESDWSWGGSLVWGRFEVSMRGWLDDKRGRERLRETSLCCKDTGEG